MDLIGEIGQIILIIIQNDIFLKRSHFLEKTTAGSSSSSWKKKKKMRYIYFFLIIVIHHFNWLMERGGRMISHVG